MQYLIWIYLHENFIIWGNEFEHLIVKLSVEYLERLLIVQSVVALNML